MQNDICVDMYVSTSDIQFMYIYRIFSLELWLSDYVGVTIGFDKSR